MSQSTTGFEPRAQASYQVRFDQGVGGAQRISGGADVIVWVDVLADVPSPAVPELPAGPAVLEAGFVDAAAVAAWLLTEQERVGRRLYIAIVAAGDGGGAFAADDVLAAGAVVDALIDLGIDDTSPEAAVACGAFTSLRRAVRHLTGASGSGRAAVASGVDPAAVHAASGLDSSTSVRIVRAGAEAGVAGATA
ncbi:2-phosphosulfolactate phosphatase [Agromyces sp. SYSU K20354]|uniref:2-phosphosulfolactate phosphatase n=1 Tax=Agromyces cavernae TaxID=2898659 RepID=UPI001E427C9D|nr:2-phosphosulfolactate phosphatase [Agromyces cavernae]MCD2441610.1 2-phosphosulfolactate phosphatase [Agromyces cavernae]